MRSTTSIDRESLDSEGMRCADDLVQGFHSRTVPRTARKQAFLCPTAVAVHYYADMVRQFAAE